MNERPIKCRLIACAATLAFVVVGCEVGLLSPEELIQTGKAFQRKGDHEKAAEYFQMALDRAKGMGEERQQARALGLLGAACDAQGAHAKAETHFQHAVDLWESCTGAASNETALALKNLAMFHVRRGNYEKAKSVYARLEAIIEKTLGADHPRMGILKNGQAFAYHLNGQHERAEELLKQAVRIFEKHPQGTEVRLATTFKNLGQLYLDQARWGEAHDVLERGLRVLENTQGDNRELHESLLNDHERTGGGANSKTKTYTPRRQSQRG